MKSDTVEGSRVTAAVQMQALAHPEVAIQFLRDGKQVLSTPGNGGLQAAVYCVYGRDFARRMEDCGIYPDVSHISDPGFWDLVRLARGPVVATHSNSRALCPHRRNLTDDMFRAIRDSGGVVGLNLYRPFVGPAGTMEELVAHVEHFLELGGEKALCLGGDLDGCEELAAEMEGIQDVPRLWQALADRGYPRQLLEDLFWNNLRRLI